MGDKSKKLIKQNQIEMHGWKIGCENKEQQTDDRAECLQFKDKLARRPAGGTLPEGIRKECRVGELFVVLCCISERKCKNKQEDKR